MNFFEKIRQILPKPKSTKELEPEDVRQGLTEDLFPVGSPLRGDGERETFGQIIWEVLKVLVVSLAIVIPIRYFIFQPFSVQGLSMFPTFDDKDYLIVDQISYYLRDPLRGEVSVFHFPGDYQEYYIKRLIALPGERIVIRDNTVTIFNASAPDGFVLHETYLSEGVKTIVPQNELDMTLREGEYFFMGDNRENSSDSRWFGAVPRSNIIGRVWLRGWPIHKIQVYSQPPQYKISSSPNEAVLSSQNKSAQNSYLLFNKN